MKVLHLYGSFPNKWQPYEIRFIKNLNNAGIENLVYSLASVENGQETSIPVYTSHRNSSYAGRRLEQLLAVLRGWPEYRSLFG